jgi:hypothetical protein
MGLIGWIVGRIVVGRMAGHLVDGYISHGVIITGEIAIAFALVDSLIAATLLCAAESRALPASTRIVPMAGAAAVPVERSVSGATSARSRAAGAVAEHAVNPSTLVSRSAIRQRR